MMLKSNFNEQIQSKLNDSTMNPEKYFQLISSSEILCENLEGPFGSKKSLLLVKNFNEIILSHDILFFQVTYVDYTASGRSIDFIEDFIKENVLPYYSNTHSDSNYIAEIISGYRNEARQI